MVLGLIFALNILYISWCAGESPSLAWQRRFDTGYMDAVQSMVIDRVGNIYLTGLFGDRYSGWLALKYSSSGDLIWQRKYKNWLVPWVNGIAVDDTGNVYINGGSEGFFSQNYFTVKYDLDGEIVWEKILNKKVGANRGGILIDNAGNVFLAGMINLSTYLIIEYDPNGGVINEKKYDCKCNVKDIAFDKTGNVYLTGFIKNNCITMKYDSSGDTVWQRVYSRGSENEVSGIAVDDTGNVYIVGWFYNRPGSKCFTVKYNSNGDTLWEKVCDGEGSDYGEDIVVDTAGNAYIVGRSASNHKVILSIFKYSSNGDVVWQSTYKCRGYYSQKSNIAVDLAGNIYIARTIYNGQTNDYLILKYIQK